MTGHLTQSQSDTALLPGGGVLEGGSQSAETGGGKGDTGCGGCGAQTGYRKESCIRVNELNNFIVFFFCKHLTLNCFFSYELKIP